MTLTCVQCGFPGFDHNPEAEVEIIVCPDCGDAYCDICEKYGSDVSGSMGNLMHRIQCKYCKKIKCKKYFNYFNYFEFDYETIENGVCQDCESLIPQCIEKTKENEELRKENERLRLELDFRPDGKGYHAAKKDFEKHIDLKK